MAVRNSTQRFSSRVQEYQCFRPGYPEAVTQLLQAECGLASSSAVADVASGTGIFTRMLLETGASVAGVEPNPEMRRAGEIFLSKYPKFSSVTGTAEATALADSSVDLLTAAQAAHWFNLGEARREFLRILKPCGWVALIWNDRRQTTEFARAYEALLLQFGTDYLEVRRLDENRNVEPLFGPAKFSERVFDNRQTFTYEGLEGRLLSSSYIPQAGDSRHQPMLQALRSLFNRFQVNGKIEFEYDTRVFYGQLK